MLDTTLILYTTEETAEERYQHSTSIQSAFESLFSENYTNKMEAEDNSRVLCLNSRLQQVGTFQQTCGFSEREENMWYETSSSPRVNPLSSSPLLEKRTRKEKKDNDKG